MNILNQPPQYDPRLVQPMREELTRIGFTELRTSAEVDALLGSEQAPTLLVVNSVCGCAAGVARPAVAAALRAAAHRPARLATVFAGQDVAATARAREYLAGHPPSSPCLALLKDGRVVWMLERARILGRDPRDVAADVVTAFEEWCR
ncbi:MAG TPA: BrxA/BrxB family bacilliredoxin [Gemmatimonadales bacterium]|nr:BrxA/BrxB family bacilliredoxin [Gemmatimonadales bacterium]